MTYTIPYKGSTIRFSEDGSGYPIILLHGYMESLDVWDDFAADLSKEYRVISIDLPGHGKTGIFAPIHTMDIMAEIVDQVIKHLNIKGFVMIGHSMGGYVALEYLAKYPNKLDGLVLFHSTPLPDTEEKKKQRDQSIEQIKQGKKVAIAKEHVQKTFAQENHQKFVKDIGFLKIIAINTSNDGIIAALEGMKRRKDHTQTINNASIPIMLILGEKDNFIPIDLPKKIKLADNVKIEILKNSGHQGFIEEKENSLKLIKSFVEQCKK